MEQESTTQKDIDALLSILWRDGRDRHHAAVTALVAERNALRKRVSYLEALSNPLYIPHGQRVESIDLRERLVCAALTGILSNSDYKLNEKDSAFWVVAYADATLAAMRKENTKTDINEVDINEVDITEANINNQSFRERKLD